METIYTTQDGYTCKTLVSLPPATKKEFLYILQIGGIINGRKLIKIGTTNNVRRRMGQLLRYFKQDIKILWVSNPYAHFTTLRVEDETKKVWRTYEDFEHIPNDRFWVAATVKELTVKVKKEFTIAI